MNTPLKCLNYIRDRWLPAESGMTLESRNPGDWRELVATFPRSSSTEVDAAVQAARQAYRSWRLVPAPTRAEFIHRVGELLLERKEELAHLMSREMGKPLTESRGDVQEGIDCAFYYAGEGRRLFGQTTPSELSNKFAMTVRVPIGVCALITPWNFPIAIPCWKSLPALVCGNTIILKPAKDVPACATFLIEIFRDAGLPAGVVNLVHGSGEEVGRALIEHPGIDLVSFTGSSQTGAEVGATCGRTHKRVCLEMGGKNAQIVLEDFEEAIAILNNTPYGLSSSVYTRDVNRAFQAMRDIEAGITYINGPTIGAEVHLPFGGVKQTGNGHREAGSTALDVFTDWKTVYVDFSGSLQRAQIDNR